MKTELELTVPGNSALAPQQAQPMALAQNMSKAQQGLAIIELGLRQNLSPESLEKLLAMKERLDAKQAEEDFMLARKAFQAESKVVLKTVNVDHKYNYAPLDHIVEAVRHLLDKHGFSYSFKSKLADGEITVVCKACHVGGHFEETPFTCRVTSGTKLMNEPQQDAWSDTFARRYTFTGAFGIVVAGEDKDANSGPKTKEFGRKKGAKAASAPGDSTAPTAASAPAPMTRKEANDALWFALAPIANKDTTWGTRDRWITDELGLDTFDRQKDSPARIAEVTIAAKKRLEELGL